MRVPRTVRAGGHPEEGFTLVEVMVSITLLAIALGAIAGGIANSLASLTVAKQRDRATALALSSVESARSLAYPQLAMLSTSSPPAAFDPDGSGPMPSEPVVSATNGLVTGAPYQVNVSSLTVATYVTWASDPRLSGANTGKRVTCVVSWPGPGSIRSVRMSTIITSVPHGSG